MNKKRSVAGLLLIVMGLLMIAINNEMNTSSTSALFETFWPTLILLFTGLMFHAAYLLLQWKGSVFFLIPGGILVTLGVFFQVAVLYDAWAYVWPGFIMAPAIAFTELYWLGGNSTKWARIPSAILFFISIALFVIVAIVRLVDVNALQWVLAAILIIAGIYMIMRPKLKGSVSK